MHRRRGLVVERSPRMREIGVRSLVGTDIGLSMVVTATIAGRSSTGVSITDPQR